MNLPIPESTYLDLCRLLAVWVHGSEWDNDRLPDFRALLQAAEQHHLTAAACEALERTDLLSRCPPEVAGRFQKVRLTSLRRTVLMDAEREKLLSFLEDSGIWYAPLKGIVLNHMYPLYGTREFADNDILFDAARWQDVRNFFKRRGYKVISTGKGAHDVYQKLPVYNFEMHRVLFTGNGQSSFLDQCQVYYSGGKDRLIKDSGNRFGYHFRDEDFYIYTLAHARKHYDGGGTGLRTVLDLYLCRRARPETDKDYLAGELAKLGLTDFEYLIASLGEKLFGPEPCPQFSEEERKMLSWIESSGVYGTLSNQVQRDLQALQGDGRPVSRSVQMRYLWRKVFPTVEWYRANAPFVYRHRWVIPFFWIYRLFRGIFAHGKRNLRCLQAVFHIGLRTERPS